MRKTKIVCTIGPASDNYEKLKEMMLAGMNVARINFSHGTYEEQQKKTDLIKKLREELRLPVSLLLDTKGPEIRIGIFNEKIYLNEGDTFTLVNDDIIGDNTKVSVSYKNLYNDINIGDTILIDDGLINLNVTSINDKDIVCKVINGGSLSNNKSVNLPNLTLNLPSLTEKDINDIKFAIDNDFDYIAASFVRKVDDVKAIKKILEENNNTHIKIISKIENREGINNFDEILKISDGIMVARGDLGVEIPMEEVPIVQKEMIKKTYTQGKVVITATQMLDSMITNPTPTRAEVSDVANAIFDGTSAIMLSGETANGKNPVECIKVMHRIATSTENSIDYWKRYRLREFNSTNFEFIINHSLCLSAMNIDAKAIFCYTKTTDTPRIITSFTPKCPIYTLTSDKNVYYQLGLVWGVCPMLLNSEYEPKKMIFDGINKVKETKLLNIGDVVMIAGGKYFYEYPELEMNKAIGGIYKIEK